MTDKSKKPFILLVEDEKILRTAFQKILEAESYRVHASNDGQQALDFLKENKPDLILLDLRMPVMDGITFLKKAELPKKFPEIKVIVFSNYDLQKDIDQAYSYGATRYILKAWASPKQLAKVVKDTLADSKIS